MDATVTVSCSHCGDQVDVFIEADLAGTMVQDCEVCSQMWRMTVGWEGGEVMVNVTTDNA
jgi:NAD-dependent SIR2 family protein deacetylase